MPQLQQQPAGSRASHEPTTDSADRLYKRIRRQATSEAGVQPGRIGTRAEQVIPEAPLRHMPERRGVDMLPKPDRPIVGREPFLELIAQRLHDLHARMTVQDCVINVVGVPGIGKTSLLAHTAHHFADNGALVLAFSVDSVGTDFREAQVRFLQMFAEALQASGLESRPLAAMPDATDETALQVAIEHLLAYLHDRVQPLFLLLDGWDQAPEALFSWVERMLLLPLVRSEQLLCVLASQGPLRWRQFEVRRRMQTYRLEPLDEQRTIEQIARGAGVGSAIFMLTFGHPLANEMLRTELPAAVHSGPAARIYLREARLAARIVDVVQERVLGGVAPELARLLKTLTIFREFDIHTLRTVVPDFVPEYKNRSDSALLLSIKQLLDTKLVSWNDDSRAYQIDPTVRKMFAQALAWNDPEAYTAVRHAARTYYAQLIRDVPSNRNVYVVEYFFHQLCLYKDASVLYNEKTAIDYASLRDLVTSIIFHYYFNPDGTYRDEESLARLHARFRADAELGDLLTHLHFKPDTLCDLLSDVPAPPLSEGDKQWLKQTPFPPAD